MPDAVARRPKVVISKADIDKLFQMLPSDEVRRTLSLADALNVFHASTDKKRCAAEIAERLEPLGIRGITLKSLYRKESAGFSPDESHPGQEKFDIFSIVDNRMAKRITGQWLALNTEFIEYWHGRVLSSKRGKVKTAWRDLLLDLARGETIPGYGTWRDIYEKEHHYRPAADEPCPYSVLHPPIGWSLRNLTGLKPDKFACRAAQIGMGAAKMDFLPTVRMTRVGLKPCQVVEIDDMWYEHYVVFAGNEKPQKVVEFAIYDRLTGYVICHLTKPVVKGWDDETRKTLKSVWVNYMYQYLFCVVGLPRGVRVVIKGEHGTASMDKRTAAVLEQINATRGEDEKIEFRAGSIITEPIAKGLPDAKHHGNPRHKGSLEGLHGTLKNIVDALCFGNIGGGRGKQPEDADTMRDEDTALMKIAETLPAATSAKLRYNFPTWGRFMRVIDRAYEILNGRLDHQMEGWEECGFRVGELKLDGMNFWKSMDRLDSLPPEKQATIRTLVAAGKAEYRERRMSPAEAWRAATAAEKLDRMPDSFAPMILGKELAHVGTVGDKLTVTVRDAETGEKYIVAAIIDGRPLPRGEKVHVWINPMDCGKAYVCDLQGRFLGVAKVLPTARADADASVAELQEQLGLRSAALADAKQKLEPLVKARLKERNEAAAANLGALGQEDPVERRELEERQRGELAGVEGADLSSEALAEEDVAPADIGDDLSSVALAKEEPTISQDDFE